MSLGLKNHAMKSIVLLGFSLFMFGTSALLFALSSADIPKPWPPETGKAYPDLILVNYDGKTVQLSSFKGKVIIVEPIGMNCPACNAFNGAHRMGGFGGTVPQPDLGSFEVYLRERTGISLFDDRIVFVQLLLYDLGLDPVDQIEAHEWAKHFGLTRRSNTYVLAGGPDMINSASYNLIPGYQLIDKQFILRVDSTGHNPRDSLRELINTVPVLLAE